MDAPELDQHTRDQIDAAEDLAGNYDDDDRDDIKTDVINAFYRGIAWQQAREKQRLVRLREDSAPLLNQLKQTRAELAETKGLAPDIRVMMMGVVLLLTVAETLLRWFTDEPKP
jgi:hypothetical protein